jgi:ribosome recycling factor
MYSFSSFTQKLEKILDHVRHEIGLLRTGKASPNMLDGVKVEAYGSLLAINELANVSAPDSNMIIIDPWDKGLLETIEKGINKAGINLNPVVDKQIIRIIVPSLTEETRKNMIKQLRLKTESAKAMMRTTRIDIKKEVEDQEGQAGVSEDDIHRDLEKLDELMSQYEKLLEQIIEKKESELLSI